MSGRASRLRSRFVCEGLEPRTLLTAIASNSTTHGEISVRAEVDSYEFDVTAGERIVLSLGEVTPAYEPYIELHAPGGALVTSDSGSTGALIDVSAAETGTYTAKVFELGNDETGEYLLHFIKLPNTGPTTDPFDGDGAVLASDSTTAASIDTPGDFDAYFVDATAGERLIASVGEVTPTYEPYVALYGPGGALITNASGSVSALIDLTAATTGRYTFLVFELGDDEIGDYLIHFAKMPNAGTTPNPVDGDGGALTSATTVSASIDAPGDIDVYSFNAAAGERMVLSLAEATPAYEPYVEIYGPGGAMLSSDSAAIGAFIETVLPTAGTYNVVVFELGNDEAGDYRLHFVELPQPAALADPFDGDGGPLLSNTTTSAAIDSAGDLDLYTIDATAGDTLIVSLGEVTPAYEPYLEVYGPGGSVLSTRSGSISALAQVVAPSTGTYNVLVAELGDDEAGDYHLYFAKVPYTGQPADPADGDGRVLTTSGNITSKIDAPGDIDLYTIPAIAGERLAASITEGVTSPQFEPYVELYGPGGTLIASNQGATTATVQTTAATTGTYVVVVYEFGDDEAGDYVLQFVRKETVVGRMVFYNNSSFDGAGDDAAIAPDKAARMPGQTPIFANVTSFTKGINGIMADVAALPGQTLSASDFTFKAGTDTNPANWLAAPAPTSITVRKGAGPSGADRVVMIWPDGAIRNQWLQVTMLANDVTNLLASDVFYFGSLVGDTGDGPLRVNALDLASVKRSLNTAALIDGRADITRDGRVSALDLAAVRANLNRGLGTITAALPAAAPPQAVAAPAATDLVTGAGTAPAPWDDA